jgi:hypothetical protein
MTLGTAMSMFRFISRVPVKDMGDGLVVEALNSGWRYAANDAKLSLFGYYKRSLTYGVSEYSLPTTITKIHRVRLLDGAVCMAEMIPSAAEDVLGRDATAEMTPGTPESCSVAFCKFEDGTSGWLLKFNCPVNWPTSATQPRNRTSPWRCTTRACIGLRIWRRWSRGLTSYLRKRWLHT